MIGREEREEERRRGEEQIRRRMRNERGWDRDDGSDVRIGRERR